MSMTDPNDDRRFIVKLHLKVELAEPIKTIARAKGISAPKLVEQWVTRLVEKNSGLILKICEDLKQLDID